MSINDHRLHQAAGQAPHAQRVSAGSTSQPHQATVLAAGMQHPHGFPPVFPSSRPPSPRLLSTPATVPLSSPQRLGRQPSFRVDPQPPHPHRPQPIQRGPSFTIQLPPAPQDALRHPPPQHFDPQSLFAEAGRFFQDPDQRWHALREEEMRRQASGVGAVRQLALRAEETHRQALRDEARQQRYRELEAEIHRPHAEALLRAVPAAHPAPHWDATAERQIRQMRQRALLDDEVRRQAPVDAIAQRRAEEEARRQAALDEELRQRALFAEHARRQAVADEAARRRAMAEEELRQREALEAQARRQAVADEDARRRAMAEEELRQREALEVQARRQAVADEEARRRARAEEELRQRDALEAQARQWAVDQELRRQAEGETRRREALDEELREVERLRPEDVTEDQIEEDFVLGHLGSVHDDDDDDPMSEPPRTTTSTPSRSTSNRSREPSPDTVKDPAPPSTPPRPTSRSAASSIRWMSVSPLPSPARTPRPLDDAPRLPIPDDFSAPEPVTTPPKPILTDSAPSSSTEQNHYRVPSPKFDHAPSPSPGKDNSAQFMALLLRQNEQMSQLMQTLVVQNQELQSVLTSQFTELAARLDTIKTPHAERESAADALDDEVEADEGDEADDEVAEGDLRVRSRKKRPQMDALKDPRNREGVRALQACVRKHLLTLCHAESMDELVENNPPITDEEMTNFLAGDEDMLACTVQSFRIDFQRSWKENGFNRLANHVFCDSLIKMYKGGDYSDHDIPSVLLTERYISKVLYQHMDYRRKLYKQHFNPLSKEVQDKIKQRKAMNARRGTLRNSRVHVILVFKLEHKRLFLKLKPIHMSGDETDGDEKEHPPKFRIVEARWQSLALKLFLRALDVLYRECWSKPVGERAKPGNAPRDRVERENPRVEDGPAPIGLWRNCYDQDWLKSLRPHERESLKIIDKDYVFTLPPPRPKTKQQATPQKQ